MKRLIGIVLTLLLAAQLSAPAFGAGAQRRTGRGTVSSGGDAAVLDEAGEPVFRDSVSEDPSHAAYVSGYEDGSFRPDRAVTRAETAKLIYSLGKYKKGAAEFSDVSSGSWYEKPVGALCAAGVLKGFPDGTFRPNQAVTRAELVTILARLDGGKASMQAQFPDVGSRHWARKAIALAQERGWVKGYTDGSFCPDRSVTRAEAVTIINRFYDRTADKAVVDADPTLRFFPDVRPGSWYYYAVMEASVPHKAHRDTPQSKEQWREPQRVTTRIRDGFYVFDGLLFVAEDGSYVQAAKSGTVNGVAYVCEGSSGICTAEGELLDTADGKRYLLRDGGIETEPGFYERSDGLFCVQENGTILRSGTYQTMQFDAEGRYTSGNAVIDAYVEQILASETDSAMTREQKLRACYDYIFYHMIYQSNNKHVPLGEDCALWAETYMLRLIDRGRGNCYCFAAEMYYFARRLGYASAKGISGQVGTRKDDHGWCQITVGGVDYVLDPRLDSYWYHDEGPGRIYMKLYSETPWKYWRP